MHFPLRILRWRVFSGFLCRVDLHVHSHIMISTVAMIPYYSMHSIQFPCARGLYLSSIVSHPPDLSPTSWCGDQHCRLDHQPRVQPLNTLFKYMSRYCTHHLKTVSCPISVSPQRIKERTRCCIHPHVRKRQMHQEKGKNSYQTYRNLSSLIMLNVSLRAPSQLSRPILLNFDLVIFVLRKHIRVSDPSPNHKCIK
jgi:hypothetical protein